MPLHIIALSYDVVIVQDVRYTRHVLVLCTLSVALPCAIILAMCTAVPVKHHGQNSAVSLFLSSKYPTVGALLILTVV